MKRVLLDSSGLRVSAAGHDVTTASGAQLLLDTRSVQYLEILLQGLVNLSAFTVDTNTITSRSGGGYNGNYQAHYDVAFGLTLPQPPICLLSWQNPFLTDATSEFPPCAVGVYNTSWWGDAGGVGTSSSGYEESMSYSATTTDLTIYVSKTFSGFLNPTLTSYVTYTILRIA
jgi:hypothetical protein